MDRRDFIKRSCGLCAALTGVGMASVALQSCSGIPSVSGKSAQNKITVPVSSFGESNLLMIRTTMPFDILLVRNASSYTALYMRCSHEENPLAISKKGLHCPSHGSRFDFDGKPVLPPATQPLQRFQTSLDSNNIIIHH